MTSSSNRDATCLPSAEQPGCLEAIGRLFGLPGRFTGGHTHGNGHIHQTYVVAYADQGRLVRYVHQKINTTVFKHVDALMENILRVTSHIAFQTGGDPARALTLIPAADGSSYARDFDGSYWRTFHFIERARVYDVIDKPETAYEAARMFGRFTGLLRDLPPPRLHETIPFFHHTPRRFDALVEAIKADRCGRAAQCRLEIETALAWRDNAGRLVDLLDRGEIPERVIHNDTKLNNVMIDEHTGSGICVVDLDTVMPGVSLYDFGDMVRTAVNAAAEDERNLSRVQVRLDIFEALVSGYLAGFDGELTAAEVQEMPFAGELITMECGVRFLTDHLNGDTYFKIGRAGHNLDRCRTQFKLAAGIRENRARMAKIVRAHRSAT